VLLRLGVCTAGAFALLLSSARLAQAEAPVVSVWYRGTPAGVPRQDDVALLRSLGFTAVSWPARYEAALPALHRLAQPLGVRVLVETDRPGEPAAAVEYDGNRVRFRVDRLPSAQLPALAWSALARGAAIFSFDAGAAEGHGVADAAGVERPWVRPAVAFAGQVGANAQLFESMTAAPAAVLETRADPEVTVALFAAPRVWVLILANTATSPRTVSARLAANVPYAIWTSLIDASTMSMLSERTGPRVTLELGPGQAAVYFADREGP
jgi:hypothetical protein